MSRYLKDERLYQVLLEPHTSEKASRLGEDSNQYAFKVAKDASKEEVKSAVETIFGVQVIGVRTLNVRGKVKRTIRGIAKKKSWKKAYVRLADGQEIDFTSAPS